MNPLIKAFVFLPVAAVILIVSLPSLRRGRPHGFYRFFAWELSLAFFWLNLEKWFVKPFSWNQLIAWPLLLASVCLVLFGALKLKQAGKPGSARGGEKEGLVGIEKTTRLVTGGIYRYIRHPLYSSLFYLAWGIFFKDPSWPGAGLAILICQFVYMTARIEEKENTAYFGEDYRRYMKASKRFIPFLF